MAFIKPSTSTNLTTPYKYKGSATSTAQNYIDLNFPNCLDGVNGGTYVLNFPINLQGKSPGSNVLTITDGYVNFNAGSILTINASDTLNMFGTINLTGVVNLTSTTVFNAPFGVNFNTNSTFINIGINSSTTASLAANIALQGQNTSAAGGFGGSVILQSGTGGAGGETGGIVFELGASLAAILNDNFGLSLQNGVAFNMANAAFNVLNMSNGSTMSGSLTYSGSGGGGIVFTNSADVFLQSGSTFTMAGGSIANFDGTTSINAGLGASSGSVFTFIQKTITLSGNHTLTSSEYNNPVISLVATLSGATTLTLPNIPGYWSFDLSNFNFNTYTFIITNGAASIDLTCSGGFPSINTLVNVYSNGSIFSSSIQGAIN